MISVKNPNEVWVRLNIWNQGVATWDWVWRDQYNKDVPLWGCNLCAVKKKQIVTIQEILAHIKTEKHQKHQETLILSKLAGG